jgi:hypothetical protein
LEIETNDVRLSFPPKRPAEALARLGGALRAERTRESADFRRVFSAEKIEYNYIMFSSRGEARGICESKFTPEPNTPDETEHFFPQEKSGGVQKKLFLQMRSIIP